jgi:hypothetical protein
MWRTLTKEAIELVGTATANLWSSAGVSEIDNIMNISGGEIVRVENISRRYTAPQHWNGYAGIVTSNK